MAIGSTLADLKGRLIRVFETHLRNESHTVGGLSMALEVEREVEK
jgi:hypothetical protein